MYNLTQLISTYFKNTWHDHIWARGFIFKSPQLRVYLLNSDSYWGARRRTTPSSSKDNEECVGR